MTTARSFAALAASVWMFSGSFAAAETIIAAEVIDFRDSGMGVLEGPYGGKWPGGDFPVPVPLTHATDDDDTTFVSLPTGSYLTVGFGGETIFDGQGDDLFVHELGANGEVADVYVSGDGGRTFVLLGSAYDNQVTAFDLASIGFTAVVDAVKVVGRDAAGNSPGFDLQYVRGVVRRPLTN